MKTHNNTIFGFDSFNDFFTTTFGLKYKLAILFTSIVGAIVGAVENWIYPDSRFVFLLLALVLTDCFTAIIRSVKNKTFTSKRLPRILAVMVSYCVMISFGWHLSVLQGVFNWLPGFLFAGFFSVLFISIFENLVELGLLPGDLLIKLKEKILTKKEKQ